MRSPSVTPPPARCKALRTHACGHARACGADANETRDCATRLRSHAPAYAQKGSCAHSPASQSASAAPGTHRPRPRAPLPLARALRDPTDSEGRGRVCATRAICSPPGARPRLAAVCSTSESRAGSGLLYVELGSDASIQRCPPSSLAIAVVVSSLSDFLTDSAVRNHELGPANRRCLPLK